MCKPRCKVADVEKHARRFALMSERDITNIVRGMMFVLAVAPGEENELRTGRSERWKRARLEEESVRYGMTAFAIRAERVCRAVFAGVMQVNPSAVLQYASLPSRVGSFQALETKNRGRRKGSKSLQPNVAVAFLQRYGKLYAMPCLTGRSSTDECVVRYFPFSTTLGKAHDSYKSQ